MMSEAARLYKEERILDLDPAALTEADGDENWRRGVRSEVEHAKRLQQLFLGANQDGWQPISHDVEQFVYYKDEEGGRCPPMRSATMLGRERIHCST